MTAACHYIGIGSKVVSTIASVSGVATLTSGVGAPIALPLGAVAMGTRGIATSVGLTHKLLSWEILKHERTEEPPGPDLIQWVLL